MSLYMLRFDFVITKATFSSLITVNEFVFLNVFKHVYLCVVKSRNQA